MQWNADKYPESVILQEYLAAVAPSSWSRQISLFAEVCFDFCAHWWFVCSGFGAGQSRVGRSLPSLFLVSADKKCWVTRSWVGFPQALPVRDAQGLQVVQELFAHGWGALHVGPCNSKDHNCSHCIETHPWAPKCHQAEIIYNSTSLCPPPPTSPTVSV